MGFLIHVFSCKTVFEDTASTVKLFFGGRGGRGGEGRGPGGGGHADHALKTPLYIEIDRQADRPQAGRQAIRQTGPRTLGGRKASELGGTSNLSIVCCY